MPTISPSSSAARRTRWIRSSVSSTGPWASDRRAMFIPAATIRRRTAGSSDAGPTVATIFVCRCMPRVKRMARAESDPAVTRPRSSRRPARPTAGARSCGPTPPTPGSRLRLGRYPLRIHRRGPLAGAVIGLMLRHPAPQQLHPDVGLLSDPASHCHGSHRSPSAERASSDRLILHLLRVPPLRRLH